MFFFLVYEEQYIAIAIAIYLMSEMEILGDFLPYLNLYVVCRLISISLVRNKILKVMKL